MGRKRASTDPGITGTYDISTGTAEVVPDEFRDRAYILNVNGVPSSHIVLGEAGTLSFEPEHAYRLDVDAIVRVRKVCRLPVIANITRLWHNDMPQEILYRLAAAAGVNGIISG